MPTARQSHNQNPTFTTETHQGGLSARRHGVSRRKMEKKQVKKQNQNQKSRTAEHTEKVQGEWKSMKVFREKRRFQRLVTRRKQKGKSNSKPLRQRSQRGGATTKSKTFDTEELRQQRIGGRKTTSTPRSRRRRN